jgi:Tol biopolymer transport system component
MRQILILTILAFLAAGQAPDRAEVQLQAAIKKEVFDGDLKGAIEQYKKIVASYGNNRAVAAKALIRMGQCYEKLGDAEATKAYERVVREFADQKEAVEQAQALLAASGRDRQSETGLTVQQKWVLPADRKTQMRHVSPDGRYIPFTIQASSGLWLHDLNTGQDRKVIQAQTDEYLDSPELSPDGKQIAYRRVTDKDYELRVADIDGSHMRVLINNKERWLSPQAWSPDAKRILILMQNANAGFSLALVSVADGSVQVLTAKDDVSNGCFSPDGKYIVSFRLGATVASKRVPGGLKLIPTDGGREVPLFESSAANWAPFWTPDGHKILFLSDRSGTIDLWSIRVSAGKPEGEPELVRRETGSIEPDPIGFTRDGVFYYKTSSLQSDIYTADLDPATGRVISKPAQVNQRFVSGVGYPMEWSPDGQFLAYTRTSAGGGSSVSKAPSIIIRSERTGEEREVIPMPAFASSRRTLYRLQWSPDGRSLLVAEHDKGRVLRQIDVQTGQVKVFFDLRDGADFDFVLDRVKVGFAPVLSHDGQALYYVQLKADFSFRLMRRNTESGEERELYQTMPYVVMVSPAPSSDGRQLAFLQPTSEPKTEILKKLSLMIMPAEGGNPRELLQTKMPFLAVNWIKNSRRLLLVHGGSKSGPPELWSVSIDGGEPQPSGLAMPELYEMAVHPDGHRIAFCSSKGRTEEVWAIKNLMSTPKPSRKSPK